MVDGQDKENIVLALAEKEKPIERLQRRRVSPNTIKAVLNRAGLNEYSSIHSRAFELFSEGTFTSSYCIKPRS